MLGEMRLLVAVNLFELSSSSSGSLLHHVMLLQRPSLTYSESLLVLEVIFVIVEATMGKRMKSSDLT